MSFQLLFFVAIYNALKLHGCAPAPLRNEKDSDADVVPTASVVSPKFLAKAPFRTETAYGEIHGPQVEYIS